MTEPTTTDLALIIICEVAFLAMLLSNIEILDLWQSKH